MLEILQVAYAALRQHSEETYPHECCGVLLGHFGQDGLKTVTRAVRCSNQRADSPHDRYEIDPKELIRIQRDSRERGEEIIGFYHSHPDHPALWSPTDLEEAHWIDCSYLITSVDKGKAAATVSFQLEGSDESDKHFAEEFCTVVPAGSESSER